MMMMNIPKQGDAERSGRAVLLLIREVPGSNQDLEIGYPDGTFGGFPQSLQANTRTLPEKATNTSSMSFRFHNSFETIRLMYLIKRR
jgi:hypothetical protein